MGRSPLSLFWASLQRFFRRKRRLQSDILIQSLAILILSIFSIITFTYYNNSRIIVSQSQSYLAQFANFLKKDATETLERAERLVQLYTPLFSQFELNQSFQDASFTHFVSSIHQALASNPHLSTLYFGTPEGYFVEFGTPEAISPYLTSMGYQLPEDTSMVLKLVQAPIAPLLSEPGAIQRSQEKWIYVLGERLFSPPQLGEKTDYDPRKRSWYSGAFGGKGVYWTNVYKFISILRGEKGITASQSIYDTNGMFKGVLAVDMTLKNVSDFLANQKMTPNAFTYLMDQHNRVLASSSLNGRYDLEPHGSQVEKELKERQLGEALLSQAIEASGVGGEDQKRVIHFHFQDQPYLGHVERLNKLPDHRWKIILIAPLRDFVGEIEQGRNRILLYSLVILGLAFVLAYRLAKNISRPIMKLSTQAQHIQNLDFASKSVVSSRIKEIADLSNAMSSLKNTVQSFSIYIPKKLVKSLIGRKQNLQVGGNIQEVTLLFTDIEQFTTISESIAPEKLLSYLSEYFEELTRIILETNGTIDKYTGDGIMAFWGAPLPDRDHIKHACRAALLCQKRLHDLNRVWKRQNRPVFKTRMGLHVGRVVVGNIGSSERMNYTVIGDEVNLASRLEGINKHYGTYIVTSEAVHALVRETFLFRPLDRVSVKGKRKTVEIYELVGQLQGDDTLYPTEEQVTFCQDVEAAYTAYRKGQFQQALQLFETILSSFPKNQSVQLYIERCKTLIKTPPSPGWDGSVVMDQK